MSGEAKIIAKRTIFGGTVFTIKAQGLKDVKKKAGIQAARELRKKLDGTTEKYTRKMANESAQMAPVYRNILRPSIAASPGKEDDMHWYYGTPVTYGRRWEYEHKTKSGYFRKSVWRNRQPYRDAIKDDLKHLGR